MMQLKTLKLVNVILIAFFWCSGASIAATTNSSNFMIKLFNNTTIDQPLHYYVTSQGQDPVEGIIPFSNDNGKSIALWQ